MTSELEYTNPYTNEEITEEELDRFCIRNKVSLTRKELHDIYQEKLVQDKQFLYEVVESDFDIDTRHLVQIKENCSDNFNEAEYLQHRQQLIMKNLERVSRRSQNSDHWKCRDCKVTADVHFMYQHECSESRLKKKKSKVETKTKAKAKDKKPVIEKQTIFWNRAGAHKDTPPSMSTSIDSGSYYYSGPAWLKQQTCHSGEHASCQYARRCMCK